jgi:hypothetical protein
MEERLDNPIVGHIARIWCVLIINIIEKVQ